MLDKSSFICYNGLTKKEKENKKMNNEVIKAMNKKSRKDSNLKKWWRKNDYKVWRVVLFPLWAFVWSRDKIKDYLNARTEWSESRADEILGYYVPRCADWDNEDKTFYLFDNGCGWSMGFAKKHLKLKDRRFWKLYASWGGGRVRRYLINSFELEGFTKEVGNCYDGWTEITFTMKAED